MRQEDEIKNMAGKLVKEWSVEHIHANRQKEAKQWRIKEKKDF